MSSLGPMDVFQSIRWEKMSTCISDRPPSSAEFRKHVIHTGVGHVVGRGESWIVGCS
jgi:hypothetical protein